MLLPALIDILGGSAYLLVFGGIVLTVVGTVLAIPRRRG